MLNFETESYSAQKGKTVNQNEENSEFQSNDRKRRMQNTFWEFNLVYVTKRIENKSTVSKSKWLLLDSNTIEEVFTISKKQFLNIAENNRSGNS